MRPEFPSFHFQPKFYSGEPERFHLPFCYDLVVSARPRQIVTLGLGDGQAHFAFCQAAREHRITVRCGVVHRNGDSTEIAHDKRWQTASLEAREWYGALSEFFADGPAEIASRFANGSVDLLLLNDVDSYDEARLALTAWDSKLSPDCIVLMHGIHLERERGLGDLWREVSAAQPAFEFPAGRGLGITLKRQPAASRNVLLSSFFSSGEEQQGLLGIYQLLADTIDARARAARAERESAAFKTRQVWLQFLLEDRWTAQDVMDDQTRELSGLQNRFEELRRDRMKAQVIMDAQREQMDDLLGASEQLRDQLREVKAELKATKQLVKGAKSACRRNGKCFQAGSEPKTRRPLGDKILREIQRIPRQLGLLPSQPGSTAKKKTEPVVPVDRYAAWIREHEPSAQELSEQRLASIEMHERPKFSLLVPVHDTPRQFLDEMIASVVAQTYDNWELCLVDGGSTNGQTLEAIARWAEREPKLRLIRLPENLGIAENTNSALAGASGGFVACVDHDDVLAPFALYQLARAIADAPEADIIYSDEDRLGVDGKRHAPYFKPEWSPALLCSFMYLGHLTAYRRSFVLALGSFRKEFDLSQDYDLALRATEVARSIRHVPHVLYHWREHPASGSLGGKPGARKSNLAALAEAMRRRNLPADVIEHPTANRARLKLARWPRVSIIIPTDSPIRAPACVTDLPRKTDYPDLEIVLITNSKLADSLESAQPNNASVRLVRYDKPFNFSDKSNVGAHAASGERLIFFNDDVEPNQPDWIQELIEQLENPEVGAVAPKMLYENGKIQHAGLVTGVRGLVGTACHQWPGDAADYTNFAQSLRDVSALSAACLAMRREDFFRVGEFDAVHTPIAHSDLDLSFKVRAAGLRCVYTPFLTMTHRGHASIGAAEAEEKMTARERVSVYLLKRWAGYSCHDPYFPENVRDWLYLDSPAPLRMWGKNEAAVQPRNGPDLLVVSHDLSWSGAPLILLHIALWCREHGFFVVVMSPQDGPLRTKFFEAGVPVLVDPLITEGHSSLREFMREFDCVVASTIFGAPIVRAAKSAGIPHLWWIHEGRVAEHYLREDGAIRAALRQADLIVTPDTGSTEIYQPYAASRVRVLNYGIPDPQQNSEAMTTSRDESLKFLLLGTIEQRKGQQVFLEALRKLPDEIRRNARFDIVGRPHDSIITRQIKAAAKEFFCLTYRESVSHDEALSLIRACDVVISASWDETGPLILMEALALSKAILSTKVGAVAENLSGEGAGIFFEPGDASALAAAIERLVREPQTVDSLGKKARTGYEKYFAFPRFAEGFLELLREAMLSSRNNFEAKKRSSMASIEA